MLMRVCFSATTEEIQYKLCIQSTTASIHIRKFGGRISSDNEKSPMCTIYFMSWTVSHIYASEPRSRSGWGLPRV